MTHSGDGGFTLTEILIVLAIIMILGAMAMPSLKTSHERMTERRMRDSLVQAIEETRLQAMLRHQTLLLCGNPVWETGWIRKTRSGHVLATGTWPATRGRLHFRLFPKGRTALVFLSTGWPEIENGSFWYCPEGASLPAWAVVLDRSGRVRVMLTNPNIIQILTHMDKTVDGFAHALLWDDL